MNTQKRVFMAVAGALIGGIAALLAAPRMGSETRRFLKTSALKQIDKVLAMAEQELESAHQKAIQHKEPDTIFT